jgi:lipopolysaccharide/colanic/teichoic acid biosynthesis glycosyltransferase
MKVLSSKSQRYPVSSRAPLQKRGSLTYATASRSKIGVGRISTYQLWKSISDRVSALLAIVILSPLLALIALGIRLDSPGSPIYRREQVGEDGHLFTAYKFRTMHINNDGHVYKAYITKYILENAPYKIDQNGQAVYKIVDDPRVTRFGALLRKTNLDELPQLFNMLKGEMSLIGPRPDIPFAVTLYKDWHRKRLRVKPGITGLWQVCGRKNLPFEAMVRLDIKYIKRQSLLLDAKILLLTVRTVLSRDGS